MRHDFEQLEQRRLLAADLAISMVDNLPEFVVPGDKLTLAATISNTGDLPFSGPVTIQFLAPNADAEDPTGVVATVVKNMRLKPGANTVVTAKIIVGDAPAPGVYNASASMQIDASLEDAPDNNTSMLEGAFDLKLVFGNFGTRRNVSLVTTDDDGTRVTFSLKGPGFGEFLSGATQDETVLHLADTTNASAFAVTTRGGDRIANADAQINVDGSLRSIEARGVNFTGGLDVLGTLGSMNVRDVTDFVMGVGSAGPAMALRMGVVTNMRLTSVSPIATLNVGAWQWLENPDRPDLSADQLSRLTAPWISNLTSAGDFSAITVLSGVGAPRMTLSNARIGGEFSGEMIALGNVGSFSARSINQGLLLASGIVGSFAVTTAAEATLWAGSITRVQVGTASNIEVGAGATFTSDQVSELAEGNGSAVTWGAGTIGDIRVKGDLGRARFAAGVNPVNGTLLDSDDLPGGNGLISKVVIGGTVQDVLFAAVTLPAKAKIGGANIITAEDDRFMFLEPVS